MVPNTIIVLMFIRLSYWYYFRAALRDNANPFPSPQHQLMLDLLTSLDRPSFLLTNQQWNIFRSIHRPFLFNIAFVSLINPRHFHFYMTSAWSNPFYDNIVVTQRLDPFVLSSSIFDRPIMLNALLSSSSFIVWSLVDLKFWSPFFLPPVCNNQFKIQLRPNKVKVATTMISTMYHQTK